MSRTTKKRTAPSSLGTVRKRSSGRYSASYRVDGRQYCAPRTFATKEEAVGWLATERADRLRGAWQDPHAGQIPLSSYLRDWLASKSPRLSQRTATTYARSIERWILPRLVDDDGKSVELGQLHLGQVTTATVRRWFAILSDATRAAALARLTYTPEGHHRFDELLRVESIFEVGRILPAHLVEHVVRFQINRGDGDVTLWFRTCQHIRAQQDHITGLHRLMPKFREHKCRTITDDNNLHAVVSHWPHGAVDRGRSGYERVIENRHLEVDWHRSRRRLDRTALCHP